MTNIVVWSDERMFVQSIVKQHHRYIFLYVTNAHPLSRLLECVHEDAVFVVIQERGGFLVVQVDLCVFLPLHLLFEQSLVGDGGEVGERVRHLAHALLEHIGQARHRRVIMLTQRIQFPLSITIK